MTMAKRLRYSLAAVGLVLECVVACHAVIVDELRLDCGSASSPTAQSWRPLHADDVYNKEQGYGWLQPPQQAFNRSSHWPGEPIGSPGPLARLPLDPLTRDGVAAEREMVLRVDVAPGDYVVRVWIGDYVERAVRQNVEVNGRPLAVNLTAGEGGYWGQVLRAAVTPVRGVATARNGALTIRCYSDANNAVRVVAIHIRRYVPAPIHLTGRLLRWTGRSDAAAESICRLLNEGETEAAASAVAAYPAIKSYEKACLLEAVAGNLGNVDLRRCGALLDESLALLDRPTTSADAAAVAERQQVIADFRTACDYYSMMSYGHYDGLTNKNRWRRYREAAALAATVLPAESLYWQAKLLAARVLFWIGMEGHPDTGEQAKPLIAQLLEAFPEHRLIRLYASKALGAAPAGDEWRARLHASTGQPPSAPPASKDYAIANADAPAWAVAERALLASFTDVVKFWLDQRQIASGELGGGWNDDVEVLRRWGAVALAIDLPWMNRAIAAMADSVWNSSDDLRQHGYPGGLGDVEHAAEDVSDSQPLAMALDYGEPRFVERLLLSSSHIERLWTGMTPKGRRHFKSFYFGWSQVDTNPKRGFDVLLSARAVKPALWAAWYTREPRLLEVLGQYSDAWVAACVEAGEMKPSGAFPAGVRFADNTFSRPWYYVDAYHQLSRFGMYDAAMLEHLLGMWQITGRERYLEPLHAGMRLVDIAADAPEGTPPWAGKVLETAMVNPVTLWRLMSDDPRYDDYLKRTAPPYLRHLAGSAAVGDVIAALVRAMHENANNFELLTSEVLFTDRIFLKGYTELSALYGGGTGAAQIPAVAVRWENAGHDLAAWVELATQNRFRARIYSFAAGARQYGMQHWRLQPGVYRLRVRRDNGGAAIVDRTVDLRHPGDTLPLDIPAKQSFLVTLDEHRPGGWDPRGVADLAATAVGPAAAGSLEWHVYNLGSKAATEVEIELCDATGVLERRTVPTLAGIEDYRPGRATISFSTRPWQGTPRLVLDPRDAIPEITERNNSVPWPEPGR